MFRSILVPFGGGPGAIEILDAAAVVGRRLGAHLDFYHVNISPGEAAMLIPHAGFAMGDALRDMLARLRTELTRRAQAARDDFNAYCLRDGIPRVDTPAAGGFSASWTEDDDHVVDRLVARSRCRDLTLIARPRAGSRLPPDILETLVVGSGRPMLVLPDTGLLRAPETVLLCWKDTPESARAAGAALPFLKSASRVVVATVQEGLTAAGGLTDIVDQLAWHGVTADVISLAKPPEQVAAALFATAEKVGADLVVMGAYGRSRTREFLFGGVSHAALAGGSTAILMAH